MTEFKDWFNAIPNGIAPSIRRKIQYECGITYAVFWNWLNEITEVPKSAQTVINNLAESWETSRGNTEFKGIEFPKVEKSQEA